MKNFLIIEDDEHKINLLKDIFNSGNINDINLQIAENVKDAVSILKDKSIDFDYLILDMALPSHRKVQGDPTAMSINSGGIEILMRHNYYNKNSKIIILTQYPTIGIDGIEYQTEKDIDFLKVKFNKNIIASFIYSKYDMNWQDYIKGLIQ